MRAMSATEPLPRVAVLSAALADQIAAGEVVERPASVVKELVENSVDAGAKRVDVELEGGGSTLIRVVDDGHGIHADDLELALARHGTSKVRTASDLVEVHTLGFRGEALASMAAVARVEVRSRPADAERGALRVVVGGETASAQPVGMPFGTQVEVAELFANVPARRKFLRSQATEVGHCSEAILRIGLVHSHVHFRLSHGGRELVDLPATDTGTRVQQVLGRRMQGGLHHVEGEDDGVRVTAWLGEPAAAGRSTAGIYLVVRRRVVRERSLLQILSQVFGAWLDPGHHPMACLSVEPPQGGVDVNVHPQKAEVRFRDPQVVYAAVRRVLADGLAHAPWADAPAPADVGSDVADRAADAMERVPSPGRGYSLTTRAASAGYADHKRGMAADVQALRGEAAAEAPPPTVGDESPVYLTCLPGPVGLFADGGDLLAVDLRALRSHLVYRRLRRDLGGEGVAAQALLSPVVIERSQADVGLCSGAREELRRLGVELEAFAEDAVIVRAVPAHLRSCVEEADVRDLVDRIVPWLRLRARDQTDDRAQARAALEAIAATKGPDPAPRLARRWLGELLAENVDLDDVPGVRRWSASALTSGGESS
jgi:DNA mismatch repair protein MutL